jgi:hypothetical protein
LVTSSRQCKVALLLRRASDADNDAL